MPEAKGIYLLRMDSKNRITAIDPIRRYLGLPKEGEEYVTCNIGFGKEDDINALVLMNDEKSDEISKEAYEPNYDDFDSAEDDRDGNPKRRIWAFRPASIKSGRIRFNKAEKNKLSMPDGDNRVFVRGGGYRFLVYSATEFERLFPDLYERFVQDDAEDE